MLRSVFPRAHQKYLSLPLLGPITDGFDDWLTASGFTQGSRTLAIHLLPIADKQLRRRATGGIPALLQSISGMTSGLTFWATGPWWRRC